MTGMLTRVADRLLSAVVPTTKAEAVIGQVGCAPCWGDLTKARLCYTIAGSGLLSCAPTCIDQCWW